MEQLLSRELIGRTAELADVYSAVRSAAGGRGGGVALVGEAGIGKSRLRLEAARYARELGVRVLPGRAPPSGHAEPFHPLREALTAGFRHGGWPDEAVVRPVLAALDPADRHQGSRLALAEALLRLLARTVRQQGALLVVEDLHRADGDTVAVVEYLVEHAADHGGAVSTDSAGRYLG